MDARTISMVTFDTELWWRAVRWSDAGISGVLLPKACGRPGPALRGGEWRFLRSWAEAIDGIVAVMAGEARDLRNVPLDARGYRRLPPGRLRGDAPDPRQARPGATARWPAPSGRSDGARDVGSALARNPFPIIVPCHRVVAANGALTGFSAPGGLDTKRRMLELEGAPGYGQQVLFG